MRLARATTRLPVRSSVGTDSVEVRRAWAEVLEHDDFGADTNFFEAGGHSLAVPRLQDALRRHTGVRPALVDLFTEVTFAAQVELIERVRPGPGGTSDASGAAPRAGTTGTTGTSAEARGQSSRHRLAEARRRNTRTPIIGDPP